MARAFSAERDAPKVLLDTLMVKFRVWDEPRILQLIAELGGAAHIKMPQIRWVSIKIDHALAADLFLAYERHPDVEDVWFDELADTTALYNTAFNDGLLSFQVNLHMMNVLPAWKHARGAGITLAVLDQGMNYDYRAAPEFASKVQNHWNSYYGGTEYPDPYTGEPGGDATVDVFSASPWGSTAHHGAACAALATAGGEGDGMGMVGVAPNADITNIAVWAKTGAQPSIPVSGMVNGVLNAVDLFGAKVISMSVIGGTPSAWVDALNYISDKALMFSGAGNDAASVEDDGYNRAPAVILAQYGGFCVGCVDSDERPAYYSGYGNMVNVVTVGHQVWTLHLGATPAPYMLAPVPWYSSFTGSVQKVGGNVTLRNAQFLGTSAATPVAAGVAALIWSANPAMSAATVRAIYKESMYKSDNWLFKRRFTRSEVGIPNALKGVLKAKALLAPGSVKPYIGFIGIGVTTEVVAGVATTHLRGTVRMEVDGFSTDMITNVQVWVGTTMIFSGLPRRSMEGTEIPIWAGKLAGGEIKVVASTATTTVEESYTDIVAHNDSLGAVAPPKTSVTPNGGSLAPTDLLTLTAESDAHPVRISYRWGSGAWQRYTGPFPAQTGNLQFYGVDCLGNVEGGVDHDPD